MGILELFMIGAGLSMDAFAVSICKGLSLQKMSWKNAAIAGLYFGGFQALMPLIGYLLGWRFKNMITQVDHWIAFVLLAFIGASMIKESKEEVKEMNHAFDCKTMLPLAVATSIDALAVGVSFAFLRIPIIPVVSSIAIVTILVCFIGVLIGKQIGPILKNYDEIIGGIILIFIGISIFNEHTNFLGKIFSLFS